MRQAIDMNADSRQSKNYQVKNIEPVIIGTDVQARIFTLAPGEAIPWHYHKETTDHYFVLEGNLTITRRDSAEHSNNLVAGTRDRIDPGTPHLIANNSDTDCRFLLLQGVGYYDWIKAD
jgi:quercetin dioxygenase-like cupin family protein